jgi:hypothetical protein
MCNMNNKFSYLAEKAGLNMHNDPIDGHDFSHELEKFAELIVQECAHLVDTLNEAYGAPSTAGKFIKEHFGCIK